MFPLVHYLLYALNLDPKQKLQRLFQDTIRKGNYHDRGFWHIPGNIYLNVQ